MDDLNIRLITPGAGCAITTMEEDFTLWIPIYLTGSQDSLVAKLATDARGSLGGIFHNPGWNFPQPWVKFPPPSWQSQASRDTTGSSQDARSRSQPLLKIGSHDKKISGLLCYDIFNQKKYIANFCYLKHL